MVLGYPTTLPVTMDEMVSMVAAVVRVRAGHWWWQICRSAVTRPSPDQALANAVRHLKEGGAQAVKLEGGRRVLPLRSARWSVGHPGRATSG